MLTSKEREMPSRIPIHFIDESESSGDHREDPAEPIRQAAQDEQPLTPEEIGRASSYEGETEIQRRIDRGEEEAEDPSRADERDVAGGPQRRDLPEEREDLDHPRQSADAFDPEPFSLTAFDAAIEEARPEVEPEEVVDHRPLQAKLERVEAELAMADAERQDLCERLTRVQADFENYRKRTEREKTRTYQGVVGDVARDLLPVLDNLQRAVEAEASVQATESEEFRHFLNGVELIHRQLEEVLKSMGLQPVETVGKPFDPHVHEAVATERTDAYEPDTVMQEIVRGYHLGERLLRPAVVKVAVR